MNQEDEVTTNERTLPEIEDRKGLGTYQEWRDREMVREFDSAAGREVLLTVEEYAWRGWSAAWSQQQKVIDGLAAKFQEWSVELTEALATIERLTKERDAIRDGSFCTKCGWSGVPTPVSHGGFPIMISWLCANGACGYQVPAPKSATIATLTSELDTAKKRIEHILDTRKRELGYVIKATEPGDVAMWATSRQRADLDAEKNRAAMKETES
jgi:hypothetical protein